ncbi:GAF domain-containing protein [Leifsonia sp. H3M29-4]|uniref:GAF domain-containing protein n=1 Tax=Salinibacterium metalliresistens TaxID=3031321 RepID=UPI0023D9A662|nr:GAF domain-containing protein [Salinibacterium metalliresistens]MDF1480233.1 GAF domain-containing protein [Salinibacterium metalliresistens]
MTSPWSIVNDDSARARLEKAHETAVADRMPAPGVRRVVQESWQRSLQLAVDPDRPLRGVDLLDDELRAYRDAHPLALALPTIHRLLIRHTFDAGLIVAVGDQDGRLLWIDGDRGLRRKAESMLFVEGADWSERAVGTSAPGTALALGHGIQIQGAEHFNRIVHPWSCTAVPVHDPDSGSVLGVIDITGGDEAVAPATLPLLEAAVAAVEAELRIRRLDEQADRPRRTPQRAVARPHAAPQLSVLGGEGGRLEVAGRAAELSTRHAEILTLLAWYPAGLTAESLAALLDCSVETLRPEMVRLRKQLEAIDSSLVPLSRPYRLAQRLDLDAHRVLAFLDRGAHRVALAGYAGPVLPTSVAPGIRSIAAEVSTRLRDSLLSDAAVDTLLDYARTDEAAYDVEVWRAVLRMLPPKSPKRASVVTRIERIESELR